MKVRALPAFVGMRDLERTAKEGKDVYPKVGEVWETTKERAEFLKSHGVVEIIEEVVEEIIEELPISREEEPIVGEIMHDVQPSTELKAEIRLEEKPKKGKKK